MSNLSFYNSDYAPLLISLYGLLESFSQPFSFMATWLRDKNASFKTLGVLHYTQTKTFKHNLK